MLKSKTTLKVKHVPQRTCVGCQKVKPKRELMRVVRTVTGGIEVDTTGKKAGRGAYLCQDPSCWMLGLKGSRLSHALHHEISQEERKQLLEYAKSLANGDVYQEQQSES